MSESKIFKYATNLPVEQRRAYLDKACANDWQLRCQVESLLRAHDDQDSFLQAPVVDHSAMNSTDGYQELAEKPGTDVGPYKIMERLGEGGFGLVFVAEQQTPIRRKVALKIIKPGMDTKEVVARFEAERQALALMDHPNIAKVLDAGTTDSGRPFFVMELVKGIPITEFCDQQRLTTRERLKQFVSVCHAVQHAHSKGIIHRDLKPSNIMISPHDGRPVVKVIDFGIAKALGQQLTDKTIYTRYSQMIGTPLYMSPEQAEINALDVDTRSDIYSLGVLLYELLTSTTPFDKQVFATAAYDEIRRIIRDVDPPKPSLRLSTLGETLSVISEKRNTPPTTLSSIVKGDLDWIVMKSLEKDRIRRYDTASGLANDVSRFLSEQPIEARPPSNLYKLRKFARRNRVLFATLTIVGMSLVATTAISATFWGLAQKGWDEARMSEANAVEKQREVFEKNSELTRANQRLTMAQAFQALADGDHDQLRALLTRMADIHGPSCANSFEYRLLAQQYLNHDAIFSTPKGLGITCTRFTPDGKHLIAGLRRSSLLVYAVRNWEKPPLEITLSEKWASTSAIEFLPASDTFLIAGELRSGRGAVAISESLTGQPTIERTFSKAVTDISIADAERFVVGTIDEQVHACQLHREKPLWTNRVLNLNERDFRNPEKLSIDVCTDGTFVSAAENGVANFAKTRIWSLETGEQIAETPETQWSRRVLFLKSTRQLLLAHTNGIELFSVEGRRLESESNLHFPGGQIAIKPGEKEIAVSDQFGGIRIFDLNTSIQKNRFVHQIGISPVVQLDFSPDGGLLASTDVYNSLKVFDVDRARPVTRAGDKTNHHRLRIEISHDSRFIAASAMDQETVRIWDNDKNNVLDLGVHPNLYRIAIARDAKQVASISWEGLVRIWDVSKPGRPIFERDFGRPGGGHFSAIAFAPSGDRIAIAGYRSMTIWTPESDHLLELEGVKSCPQSIDFSPNGRYVVLGGGTYKYHSERDEGIAYLWDLQSKETTPAREIAHQKMVYEVDFHPAGEEFAIGGLHGEVKTYNLTTQEISGFSDDSWWVTGLAYTADGKSLATASSQRVTFWDTKSRNIVGRFQIPEYVRRVGFMPNGCGMITLSVDEKMRIWNAVPPGTPIDFDVH